MRTSALTDFEIRSRSAKLLSRDFEDVHPLPYFRDRDSLNTYDACLMQLQYGMIIDRHNSAMNLNSRKERERQRGLLSWTDNNPRVIHERGYLSEIFRKLRAKYPSIILHRALRNVPFFRRTSHAFVIYGRRRSVYLKAPSI